MKFVRVVVMLALVPGFAGLLSAQMLTNRMMQADLPLDDRMEVPDPEDEHDRFMQRFDDETQKQASLERREKSEACRSQAMEYMKAGDFERAAAAINQGLVYRPNGAEMIRLAAHIYTQRRQFDTAEYHAARLAKAFPENPNVLATWGGLLFRTDRPRKARAVLNQALALNADSVVARYNLACVCAKLGEYLQAQECVRSTSFADSGQFATWLRDEEPVLLPLLGERNYWWLAEAILTGGGQYLPPPNLANASSPAASADSLRPVLDAAARELWTAQVAMQEEQWAAAAEALERANEAGVTAAAVSKDTAYCRYRAGEKEKAYQTIESLLEREPRNPVYAKTKGFFLLEDGRCREARPYLERAHEGIKSDRESALGLACAYIELGLGEEAWKILYEAGQARSDVLLTWLEQDKPYFSKLRTDPRYAAWVQGMKTESEARSQSEVVDPETELQTLRNGD